jgi:glyoxylate reductase
MACVLITSPLPPIAAQILAKRGHICVSPHTPVRTAHDLKRSVIATGCDAMITILRDPVTQEVLETGRLRCVAQYAVGYDNIDVATARRLGIVVTHTPGVLTDATAEMALALMFATGRRIVESDRYVREGKFTGWEPLLLRGPGLTGKTLGIVGAGRIGRRLGDMARGIGMRVVFQSRSESPSIAAWATATGAERRELDALIAESDYLSLHTPLTPQTRHLIDARRIGLMKRDAILINTARGPIVDEAAMIAALQAGKIGGAGLDVFEREPEVPDALKQLDNVVLAPHTGSATIAARDAMAAMVAEDAARAMIGEAPIHPVPELA